MALYNIESKKQNPTGTKECWKNFDLFVRSEDHKELYNTLIIEISNYIDKYIETKEVVDSNKLGSFIINKIKQTDFEKYKFLSGTLHGGMFGMTLYNFLANDHRDWYFLSRAIDRFDEKNGSQYFMKTE